MIYLLGFAILLSSSILKSVTASDLQCYKGAGRIPCIHFFATINERRPFINQNRMCNKFGMKMSEFHSKEDADYISYVFKINGLPGNVPRLLGAFSKKTQYPGVYRYMSGPAFTKNFPFWAKGEPKNQNDCILYTIDSQGNIEFRTVYCSTSNRATCEACLISRPMYKTCSTLYACPNLGLVCRENPGPGCERAFYSNKTDYLPCPHNRYGCECQFQCHCADKVPCDLYSGICPAGCEKNWQGPKCDQTLCALGKFGSKCDQFCLCANQEQCDVETGQCAQGCEAGMDGLNCSQSLCKPGLYGSSCKKMCPCAAGAYCGYRSGRCLSDICKEKMKVAPRCTESSCPVGKYGSQCTEDCSCGENEPCHWQSGICETAVCPAIGKGGLDCYDECPKELTCKRCLRLNMTKCGECVEGFRLTPNNTCEKVAGFVAVSASNMWVIILIVVLLIVILVALVDIYIFLQKKDEHSEASQDGEKGLEEQSEQSSEKHEGASDKDEEESMQGSEDEEGDENPQTGEKKESSASSKKHSSASSKKHSSASSKKHSSASSKKQSNASKKQSNVSKMSTVSENLE